MPQIGITSRTPLYVGGVRTSALYRGNRMIWPKPPVFAIPWAHLWWVEGPKFQALGYTDTQGVSLFPDEAGAIDFVQATSGNRPPFDASVPLLGDRPALAPATSVGHYMTSAAPAAIPGPTSLVAVTVGAHNLPWDNYSIFGQSWSGGLRLITNNSTNSIGMTGDHGATLLSASSLWSAEAGHLIVGYENGASSQIDLDGTTVATGNAGGNGSLGATALSLFRGTPEGGQEYDRPLSLLGIASGDIRTHPRWDGFTGWVSDHYGIEVV